MNLIICVHAETAEEAKEVLEKLEGIEKNSHYTRVDIVANIRKPK